MRKILIVVVTLLSLAISSYSQISTPAKKKFNMGVYAGINILRYKPIVGLDFSFVGTTLRGIVGYQYYSVGLSQELLMPSKVFYNLYWTGTIYYAGGKDDVKGNFQSAILATGLKTYFAKRFYTHVMAGISYSSYATRAFPGDDLNEVQPYFEFGLGMNIFKNYPHPKIEETEE